MFLSGPRIFVELIIFKFAEFYADLRDDPVPAAVVVNLDISFTPPPFETGIGLLAYALFPIYPLLGGTFLTFVGICKLLSSFW